MEVTIADKTNKTPYSIHTEQMNFIIIGAFVVLDELFMVFPLMHKYYW